MIIDFVKLSLAHMNAFFLLVLKIVRAVELLEKYQPDLDVSGCGEIDFDIVSNEMLDILEKFMWPERTKISELKVQLKPTSNPIVRFNTYTEMKMKDFPVEIAHASNQIVHFGAQAEAIMNVLPNAVAISTTNQLIRLKVCIDNYSFDDLIRMFNGMDLFKAPMNESNENSLMTIQREIALEISVTASEEYWQKLGEWIDELLGTNDAEPAGERITEYNSSDESSNDTSSSSSSDITSVNDSCYDSDALEPALSPKSRDKALLALYHSD